MPAAPHDPSSLETGKSPDTSPLAVRLAHVSDIHVGAEDGPDSGETLVAELRAAHVAATIITGDLTTRARSREFARAKELVDSFPAPTMVVIGNHDVPLLNPVRRLARPYGRFRDLVSADLDPLLELPGVRIRGLGSMPRWRWKSGRISDRQAELVRTTFADAPPGMVRVVALHHPPSSHDLQRIAGRGGFERALVDAEVDVVLAGHTHVPTARLLTLRSRGRTHTVLEVVAGTATSRRTRGVARSWSLVELSADRVTVTEHLVESGAWRPGRSRSWPLHAGSHGDS